MFSCKAPASTVALVCLLTACSGTPEYPLGRENEKIESFDDIGDVSVKAFPLISFESIRDKLTVKHNLTMAEALVQAISTTMSDDASKADSFVLDARAGLQLETVSTERHTADGVTTSTRTETSAPGELPDSRDPVTSVVPALRQPPALSPADAFLARTVATGLTQYTAWLDNYIGLIEVPKHYQATLLTFQVAVQPKKPFLPVDAYVDIVIWPSSVDGVLPEDKNGLPMVMLHPLIMTDNLEASSRNLRATREAKYNAGIMGSAGSNALASIFGGAGSSGAKQRLGQDLNGVTTLAVDENNHIKVRLGAQASASAELGYGLVSRTHVISVLMLTHSSIKSVQVDSQDYFVDVRGKGKQKGKTYCENRELNACDDKIVSLAQRFNYTIKECESLSGRGLQTVQSECESVLRFESDRAACNYNDDLWQDFVGLLKDVHWTAANACLADYASKSGKGESRELFPRERNRFYSSLLNKKTLSRMASFTLPIPFAPLPLLPNKDQTVPMTVKGDTVSAYLRGGRGLSASALFATWNLTDKIKIPASGVKVGEKGSDLYLTFPRHAGFDQKPTKQKISLSLPGSGGAAKAAGCEDKALLKSQETYCTSDTSGSQEYGVTLVQTEDSKKSIANPIVVDTKRIVVDVDGTAMLNLRLPKAPDGKTVTAVISGADVVAVKGSAESGGKGTVFKSAGSVTVTLGNVVPGALVSVAALVGEDRADTVYEVYAFPKSRLIKDHASR